jgi:hypothetical protein
MPKVSIGKAKTQPEVGTKRPSTDVQIVSRAPIQHLGADPETQKLAEDIILARLDEFLPNEETPILASPEELEKDFVSVMQSSFNIAHRIKEFGKNWTPPQRQLPKANRSEVVTDEE